MKKSDSATKNALEWSVFGISGVLVIATLSLLVLAVFQTEEGPAKLVIKSGPPTVENGWVKVPVTVTNEGRRVAANVEVQVCVGEGDDRREAGFSIDFVPRGGEANGSVSFKGPTLPGDPQCEVLGYEEP